MGISKCSAYIDSEQEKRKFFGQGDIYRRYGQVRGIYGQNFYDNSKSKFTGGGREYTDQGYKADAEALWL